MTASEVNHTPDVAQEDAAQIPTGRFYLHPTAGPALCFGAETNDHGLFVQFDLVAPSRGRVAVPFSRLAALQPITADEAKDMAQTWQGRRPSNDLFARRNANARKRRVPSGVSAALTRAQGKIAARLKLEGGK